MPEEAAAHKLVNTVVTRIANNSDVPPETVHKVLNGELGLASLQSNLAKEGIDLNKHTDGRLVLAWVANRKLIFA